MAVDADHVRHGIHGGGKCVGHALAAHVDMYLRRFGWRVRIGRLQGQVQQDVLVERMRLLGQRAGARGAGQEGERHGPGKRDGPLAVGQVVTHVVDNDRDARCVCRGDAGEEQEAGGEEAPGGHATGRCCA